MEAISEKYTMAELADRHGIHPNQISQWKRKFIDNADVVFEKGNGSKRKDNREREELLKVIGELKVENSFLKKKL